MLNQAHEPVIDESWVASSEWRRLDLLELKQSASEVESLLDKVPVMSATVLGLEILLRERCIDLSKASEIVLSDVGATIQTLRFIGQEYEFAVERPSRMADCIASLDVGGWFDAISARTFTSDPEHSATTAVWKHCRLIAQYAQLVAESLENITSEDAYLVGLLHDTRAIPIVLGWENGDQGFEETDALLEMDGSLPPFVLSAMQSVDDSCRSSIWTFVLDAAHELAGGSTEFDASTTHVGGSPVNSSR